MDNGSLKVGTGFKTKYGGSVKVEKYIAEGGRGEVYIVTCNSSKNQKALVWYRPDVLGANPCAFYDHIDQNIKRGSPDPIFLWPEDITERVNGTFGYVIALFPHHYYALTDFMLCSVRFKSFRTIADAALQIVSAYCILHHAGYTCQNMTDGNIFIDLVTGKILICYDDDMAPDGCTLPDADLIKFAYISLDASGRESMIKV